jgi:2-polyprenyl-3-methyl-5-hydroxy-6-metoxy-1,4-benzoquinol methylase
VYFDCDRCRALLRDRKCYVTPEEEKRQYLLHNNDVHDPRYQQFVKPVTEYILRHYLPAHRGLDFGCGTGPVISKVVQDQGYAIAQYDPFFAPDEGPLGHTYDYIVLCEVVEHFHHPDREFRRLKALLRPGGCLLIMTLLYEDSIPFVRWQYRMDDTHVFISRRETIEYVCEQYGLAQVVMTRRFMCLQKQG